jgi:hypothetical protein
MNISEPYMKVIHITFDGNICENELRYELPERDRYLQLLKLEFEQFLADNYWGFRRVQGYSIIFSEIVGPDSSSYPNYLNFYIGFRDETAESRFKFLLDEFEKGD